MLRGGIIVKPLHECAVIKDGNKRVGYFVMQADSVIPDSLTAPWIFMDREAFTEAVKANQVQYLVFENNSIRCRYTQEEAAELRKKHLTNAWLEETQDNYWNMDVTFKSKHINAQTVFPEAICMTFGSPTKVFGMSMIPIYMYGYIPAMVNLINILSNKVNNPNLNNTFKHNSHNIGSIVMPVRYLDTIADLINSYKIFCDTSTCRYVLANGTDVPRIPLLMGKVKEASMLDILNRIDRETTRLENRIIPTEIANAEGLIGYSGN